jgi:short-subunit dehydrogenase
MDATSGDGAGRRWRRALVTGASSGIGEAMARRLAAEGTELVVVARDGDRLRRLAGEVPVACEVVVADLADRAAVERVAERILADPAVDLVVNNAGFGRHADLVDEAPATWVAMVDVNVTAVVRLTHAALTRFRRSGQPGTVVNVASVAGFAGSAGLGVYSASKAFLVTLGAALHDEARRTGSVVCTLCPGLTRTEFHQRAGLELAPRLAAPLWQSADEVAVAGLDGAAAGRELVVPGAVNKVVVAGTRLVPRRVLRRVAAVVRARR